MCDNNKIYNPITKRYVLKSGKIGKKLLEDSKNEKKEVENEKIRKEINENNNEEIKILNDINEKFINYSKIADLIKINFKENISGIIADENNNDILNTNKYYLGNNIILYKKIGSSSRFGEIYKTKIIDKNNNEFYIATKLQLCISGVTDREIQILNSFKKYALNYKIHNLPLVYKIINFNKDEENIELLPPVLRNKKKKYNILLNELAEGDLKYFIYNILNTENSYELWKNTIEQIYMTLVIIHSLHVLHNDSHYGNFLYYRIKPGGYFHYKINDIDIYIENLGYYWTIWDFGVSSNVRRHIDYLNDYNFLCLFLRKDDKSRITEKFKNKYSINVYDKDDKGKKIKNKDYRKWGSLDNNINIPIEIEKLVEKLWIISGEDIEFSNEYYNKKIDEYKYYKKLLEQNLLFKTEINKEDKILSTIDIKIDEFKDECVIDKSKMIIKIKIVGK
jgi:hypothetical protein